MIIKRSLVLLSCLLLNSVPVFADVLLIDSIESAPAIQTPDRGLSMSQVRQQFGEPVTSAAAIGEPPITRWDYADYSVFFENDTALHSVIHQASK